MLDPAKSAALRDQLFDQLAGLASSEAAAVWAKGALERKNTLTIPDAELIEAAFQVRLNDLSDDELAAERDQVPDRATAGKRISDDASVGAGNTVGCLGPNSPAAVSMSPEVQQPSRRRNNHRRSAKDRDHAPGRELSGHALPQAAGGNSASGALDPAPANAVQSGIDKGALALSEPRRYRDRIHLRFVSSQPCLLCGRRPSDAHHLRFAQPAALGRRVSDEFTVPLCRIHHRDLHRRGDEAAWWQSVKLDPVAAARKLWEDTRLNVGAVNGPEGGDNPVQAVPHGGP